MNISNGVKVCYFGIYDPNYSRSRVLKKGLRENGVEVIECRIDPREKHKYWKLFKKHKTVGRYDVMLVGFPGQPVMPLARLISKKPIIFDAFLSRYDSIIFDRKEHLPFSFQALKCWFFDWLGCKLANKVLLDTKEHIDYFVRTFKIKKEKFRRIFIGADDSVFYPQAYKKDTDEFLVHFHGTFIPLQGIEYIVEAAKILENENIKFNLIGKGQTYSKAIDLAGQLGVKNVNFEGVVPYLRILEYLNKSDIALGIFGSTPKARRVIPCKVYEALASGKPIITEDSPAAREILTNRENVLFCKMASGKDLAEKILELRDDGKLREKIARGGYKLFKEKLTPKMLGYQLKKIIEDL